MCTRLVRGGAPGASTSGHDEASDKASLMLQVGLATLSLLVDDGRASEFAYNTDIALLQACTRGHATVVRPRLASSLLWTVSPIPRRRVCRWSSEAAAALSRATAMRRGRVHRARICSPGSGSGRGVPTHPPGCNRVHLLLRLSAAVCRSAPKQRVFRAPPAPHAARALQGGEVHARAARRARGPTTRGGTACKVLHC